jgi:hypothetical protein
MPTQRWLAPLAALLIPTGILLSGHATTRRMAIDSSATQQHGDLRAMLLLTTQPDRFLESWRGPEEEISLRSAVSVRRGEPIVTFVIFRGCEADANGLCQSSVDFRVLKPDGSEYLSFEDRDLWRGKPALPEGAVQVSAEHLGVVIEPGDPLGRYEVQVVVRDEIANVSLRLSRTFDAVAP